jgi:hypothetical protein
VCVCVVKARFGRGQRGIEIRISSCSHGGQPGLFVATDFNELL